MTNFSIETFAQELKDSTRGAKNKLEIVRQLLQTTIEKVGADAMIAALEAAVPKGADVGELIVHQSEEFTLLFGRVPAHFQSGIHDHTVCACIGQLSGEERSVIYAKDESGDGLRVAETITIKKGEVMTLPKDAIHHIENPRGETSCALHIYGGDFGAIMDRRSLWTSGDHKQTPFSFPALLKESASSMKASGNQEGLEVLKIAMPAAKAMVEAL